MFWIIHPPPKLKTIINVSNWNVAFVFKIFIGCIISKYVEWALIEMNDLIQSINKLNLIL